MRDRRQRVNLFLIEGPDDTHHYVWIKNMFRLVTGRIKTRCTAFVCNHCLHLFSTKYVHDLHVPNCQHRPPQDVKYPDPKNPDECTLQFRKKASRFRLSFYLVCDFQSFLTPIDRNEDVDAIMATNPSTSTMCVALLATASEYQSDPVVYS